MHQLLHFSLIILLLAFFKNSYGFENHINPPDSSTNIINKTAANYFIKEGKSFFSMGKIKDALIKFRQANVKDPYNWKADYWIGKCHYRLNNYGYALKYTNSAIEKGKNKIDDEIYYLLATSNHRLGNLEEAIINYKKANTLLSKARANTLRIEHHINECNFAIDEIKKGSKYKKSRIQGGINSAYDDYQIILSKDGNTIYFVSRRSNTTGGGLNPDDQHYFEDTYKSIYNKELKEWSMADNELGKLNSNGFDALNYINSDGNVAYLTVNSTYQKSKTPTKSSDICIAKLNSKGSWNYPKPIKNINTSYFEGSASLTADGNTMYFVSDRKGDTRSTDIYVSQKNGKSWGEAIPLSDSINTSGRETTPFISPDGKYLFFSSDGHLGFGNLDVYVSENIGGKWSSPINLGYGINSVNDDTHFYYNKELQKAFISGFEIVGNKANIDCYEIDMQNFKLPKK